MSRHASLLAALLALPAGPLAAAEAPVRGPVRVERVTLEPAPLRSVGDRFRLESELARSTAPGKEAGRYRLRVGTKSSTVGGACGNVLFANGFEDEPKTE
jgi:hypothetical protein